MKEMSFKSGVKNRRRLNQEESEHNEVDGMKKGVDCKGEVMHI